jgi:hypothetical protein
MRQFQEPEYRPVENVGENAEAMCLIAWMNQILAHDIPVAAACSAEQVPARVLVLQQLGLVTFSAYRGCCRGCCSLSAAR